MNNNVVYIVSLLDNNPDGEPVYNNCYVSRSRDKAFNKMYELINEEIDFQKEQCGYEKVEMNGVFEHEIDVVCGDYDRCITYTLDEMELK